MTGNTILHRAHTTPPVTATEMTKRDHRTIFGDNTTSSLDDNNFGDLRGRHLSAREKRELRDGLRRIEKCQADIQLHFEKRFSHLFALAALCYRTDYIFSEGATKHQGLGAHKIVLEEAVGGRQEEAVHFAGAHHATLPCLYAKSPDRDLKFVFAYRSGIYDEGQATLNLPLEVNQADSAIDGKSTDDQLRARTVVLLNRASKGELTPAQVSIKFGKRLIVEIEKALSKRGSNPLVKRVLELYRDHAEYLAPLPTRPEVIDRWLNLQLDASMQTMSSSIISRLKRGAEVSRSDLLALIRRKVDDLPVSIRQETARRENEHNAPNHFRDLYLLKVLKRFQTTARRRVMEEALDVKKADLLERANDFRRCLKTKTILKNNAARIDNLVEEITPLVLCILGKKSSIRKAQGLSEGKKIGLRPDIYRLRYQMIQDDQATQSKIKSDLEQTLEKIKSTCTAPYLNDFFYYTLLNRCQDSNLRTMLSRLLNKSYHALSQRIREIKVSSTIHREIDSKASYINDVVKRVCELSKRSHVSTARKKAVLDAFKSYFPTIHSNPNKRTHWTLVLRRLYDPLDDGPAKELMDDIFGTTVDRLDSKIAAAQRAKKPPLQAETHMARQTRRIDRVIRQALASINELKLETDRFRGRLLAELRKLHGLKQQQVIKIYQHCHPTLPMCAGTMSELETSKKKMDADMTRRLAAIFDVSASLFYPGHFAETA